MKTIHSLALRITLSALGLFAVAPNAWAQEDDYEFLPPHGWRGLAESGDDDATSRLAEGFEGLNAEPGKNTTIEPVDGAGGFDNVAPMLGAEEGPGGLDWDPSPTYRTKYKNGTDYVAGAGNRLQGNNWFLKIPYVTFDSGTNQYRVRFDANQFRVYTFSAGSTWVGQYGNKNSKIVRSGSSGSYIWSTYDTRGKAYTFQQASPANSRLTKIQGLGGAEITLTYGASTITVLQKPSASAGTELRRFTYTIASNRIDKIDIEEKISGTWTLYRKIDFTYHENIVGAVESTTGDLIGIQEDTLLSPASTWLTRKWVFKYFTGAYNVTANPGNPYQVKAVLGPQSVHDWEVANAGVVIYTKTTAQLASYVDRQYEYHTSKLLRQIDFKSGCGCGGGEGVYIYAWDAENTSAANLNTWFNRVTITLPSVNGSSRIIDYNKYGELLNHVAQEVAGNTSSRRWIMTWAHDTTGRLTDTYSVEACTAYTDATHAVTTTTSAGMRYQYTYDANSALLTATLRDPTSGNLNLQSRKSFDFLTSGDRRRFIKRIDRVFRAEVTTDDTNFANPDTVNYATTKLDYTYHATDALAVKKRTTTLPVVIAGENGLGTAVTALSYFETDGLPTWSKDGDGFVHYTGYNAQRRVVIQRVVNINTSAPPTPTLPVGSPQAIPAPPDVAFQTTSGLNLFTEWDHDPLRRAIKQISPAFNAWDGSSVVSTKTTSRWYYTKLSGGELVTVAYQHLIDGTSYFHYPIGLTVQNFEGHTLTSAAGVLVSANQDADITNDINTAKPTIEEAFSYGTPSHGALVRRTDYVYDGSKLTQDLVWSVADNSGASKYTTIHTYDAAGRRLTTRTPAGTYTRWTYDVLNRAKTTETGTDVGTPGNMTLVEERFYDDEQVLATNTGEGNLTELKRYTSQGGAARITDMTYDYRRRVTDSYEPLAVRESRTYTNLNQLSFLRKFDNLTLTAQTEHVYDAWGQELRTKEYRVPLVDTNSDSSYDYAKVERWRNGRGSVVKTLSQGKVFQKTQYDGAGRTVLSAVSYDAAETTSYAAAFDLVSDTVIEQTKYELDPTGAVQFSRHYQRRHDGSGTGDLTVGTTGNGRAQFAATWYDKVHRATHAVSYGTNGGPDLTTRPAGSPPSSSSASSLVSKYGYYLEGQTYVGQTLVYTTTESIDPMGLKGISQQDDAGHTIKQIENFVNWTSGTDDDRTREYAFDSVGRLSTITAKASTNDQVTLYTAAPN